jgi:hypothetical protein
VDFQLTHWTSPAIDLQYFLHTSPSQDLLDKHEVLVEEYYKYLSETLSALGYQGHRPPLNQIKEQLQSRGMYAVATCCTILPVLHMDKNDMPDFTSVENMANVVHLSERYKTTMKNFLPVFEHKGWL